MHLLPIYILFIPFVFGTQDTSDEDFKCALPEVSSLDDNVDLMRFRKDFAKVSEVKFPGLIGPLKEKRMCKIKCIDGNWVGPLCSKTPDGRFQPILRDCHYKMDNPTLDVYFKNASITSDTSFPHASEIFARCKSFGLYKTKGDSQLRCTNGEWVPKFPECVPTTLLTNFTGEAPPSITYTLIEGSGLVDANGSLVVFPGSTVRLSCITLRAKGNPEWSWTQASPHRTTDWSIEENEKDTHFRLTLAKMTPRQSDNYTCRSPCGLTNTVTVKVVTVSCPPVYVSDTKVRHFAQGNRLGQTTHFSCLPGHHLNGSAVLTCMVDGLWSSDPPVCMETFCPLLTSIGPHISVVEYNSSFGGRAVFQCSWGYRLIGAPGLECEIDGKWSGKPPICIPIYCPDPLVPENGRLLTEAEKGGKYHVGDLVVYACHDGYELMGEYSIVCTENGFWSHPQPFCLLPSDVKKANTIYVENTTMIHFEE